MFVCTQPPIQPPVLMEAGSDKGKVSLSHTELKMKDKVSKGKVHRSPTTRPGTGHIHTPSRSTWRRVEGCRHDSIKTPAHQG